MAVFVVAAPLDSAETRPDRSCGTSTRLSNSRCQATFESVDVAYQLIGVEVVLEGVDGELQGGWDGVAEAGVVLADLRDRFAPAVGVDRQQRLEVGVG